LSVQERLHDPQDVENKKSSTTGAERQASAYKQQTGPSTMMIRGRKAAESGLYGQDLLRRLTEADLMARFTLEHYHHRGFCSTTARRTSPTPDPDSGVD